MFLKKQAAPLVLIAVLSGCGGQAAPSVKPAAAASQSPVQALYEQAQKEGHVNWNSSSAESIVAGTIAAFEKAYPGVKINYTSKPAPQVMTDVQVQQAAKKVDIDVAQSADLNIVDTLNGHLPMQVDWAKLGVPTDRILEGQLVNYTDAPFITVYNKNKVAAADLPKTWDDVINPKWQGQLNLDGRGTFLATYIAEQSLGGAAKGIEIAKKLDGLKPLYGTNFQSIEPTVISGQVAFGSDSLSNFLAQQKKGAPIYIVPISPVYVQRSPAYVPAGAPHPNAAQLLITWLVSAEGQQKVAEQGAGTALSCSGPDQQGPAAQAMCTRGIKSAFFTSLDQFQQLADYLTQIQKAFGTYSGK